MIDFGIIITPIAVMAFAGMLLIGRRVYQLEQEVEQLRSKKQ